MIVEYKRVIYIVLGLLILLVTFSYCSTPVSASEQVTFTVNDKYLESRGQSGIWYLFIETTDNKIYYAYELSGVLSMFGEPTNELLNTYESFAPNTTHTVSVEGHKLMIL